MKIQLGLITRMHILYTEAGYKYRFLDSIWFDLDSFRCVSVRLSILFNAYAKVISVYGVNYMLLCVLHSFTTL